jgi:hypothetical protein
MRSVCLWVTVAVVVAVAGCGASSGEIKRARLAVYHAPSTRIYEMALEAAGTIYKIGQAEPERRRFATRPQWYSDEGGRQSGTDEGNGEYVPIRGGSIQLSFLVEVMEVSHGNMAVEITPRTFQVVSGSPQPRELTPEDPNLPPWVKGRVDSLALAIYDRAKIFSTPP